MFLGDESLRKPYEGLDASRENGIAKSAGKQRAEAIGRVRNRSICLAAGFVFAAARWAIGVVNEYVIVAGRADHTVDRLAELLMAHLGFVLCRVPVPRLMAIGRPFKSIPDTDQSAVSELKPMPRFLSCSSHQKPGADSRPRPVSTLEAGESGAAGEHRPTDRRQAHSSGKAPQVLGGKWAQPPGLAVVEDAAEDLCPFAGAAKTESWIRCFSARAFRARDDGVLLHHDPFVMLLRNHHKHIRRLA